VTLVQSSPTNDTITCKTQRGSGKNLVFKATVDGVFSELSRDTYSFPPPSLKNGTIRLQTDATGKALLVSSTTQGEPIFMDGINFSLDPDENNVTYGEATPRDFSDFLCVPLPSGGTASRLSCTTSPGA
jgi:hypothetical protein